MKATNKQHINAAVLALRTTEIAAMSETGNLNEALATLVHLPWRA